MAFSYLPYSDASSGASGSRTQSTFSKPAAPYAPPPVDYSGTAGILDYLKNLNPANIAQVSGGFALLPGDKPTTNTGVLGPSNASAPFDPRGNQSFLSNAPIDTSLGGSGPPKFNFGNSLNSDPGVMGSLALEQQGLSQLDANLKAARERAIISFGDPSLAQEAGFGLDPQAGAFARQNYLSGNATTARLDKAHELARKAVIDKLAGHGLLFSGDTGYQEGQADQAYGNQTYDAKQQLLDYLGNLFQTYTDKRNQLSQGTVNARLQAIQNYLSNPDGYAAAFGG